VMAFIPWPFR